MKTALKLRIWTILEEIKQEAYTQPENATDAMAMGLLMSKYFEWDGLEILKATYEALEDSNFHTENETIQNLITKVESSV